MAGRIALTASVVAVLTAAPALADTQERAAAGASNVFLTVDPDDRTVVSWTRHDGDAQSIETTALDESGNSGPVTSSPGPYRPIVGPGGHRAFVGTASGGILIAVLDDAGAVSSIHHVPWPGIVRLQAEFDPQGRMSIVFESYVSGQPALYALRTDSEGRPGSARSVFQGGSQTAWDIAVDSAGRTTVVRSGRGVDAVQLDPEGAPGPVQSLSTWFSIEVHVALDALDRPVVVWQGRADISGPVNEGGLQGARLADDGTPGEIWTLDTGIGTGVRLAVDQSGGAAVFWQNFPAGPSTRGIRIPADAPPRPATAVTPAGSLIADVAFDSADRARITWSQDGAPQLTLLDPELNPIETRELPGVDIAPRIAIDSQDRVTLAWLDQFNSRPYESYGIAESVRLGPAGELGEIRALSAGDASPPALSLTGGKQRVTAVVGLSAGCDEWCNFAAAGSVALVRKGGAGRAVGDPIPLGATLRDNVCTNRYGVQSRCVAALRLKLERPARELIRAALERGRKAIATVEVLAADDARNLVTGSDRLRLVLRDPNSRTR